MLYKVIFGKFSSKYETKLKRAGLEASVLLRPQSYIRNCAKVYEIIYEINN